LELYRLVIPPVTKELLSFAINKSEHRRDFFLNTDMFSDIFSLYLSISCQKFYVGYKIQFFLSLFLTVYIYIYRERERERERERNGQFTILKNNKKN